MKLLLQAMARAIVKARVEEETRRVRSALVLQPVEPTIGSPAKRGEAMKKHFVTFFSPGTFVAETSAYPIDSWDVEQAIGISRSIKERYGATPYGFQFSTRERGSRDLDSKVSATSGTYYLGGRIDTLADVQKRADPKEKILLANMKCNGIERIIVNDNSWRFSGEFKDGDTLLEYSPDPSLTDPETMGFPE